MSKWHAGNMVGTFSQNVEKILREPTIRILWTFDEFPPIRSATVALPNFPPGGQNGANEQGDHFRDDTIDGGS